MSWAEVKGALNGAFDGDRNKTLDRIIAQRSYDSYYDTMVQLIKSGVINLSEVSYIEKGVTVLNSNYPNSETAKKLIVPRSVVEVQDMSFFDTPHSLEEFVLPDSVKKIGFNVFGYGKSLKKVFLPKSIELIGQEAFGESQITDIYCGFSEGAVSGAPWGATNATIHYDCDYCW